MFGNKSLTSRIQVARNFMPFLKDGMVRSCFAYVNENLSLYVFVQGVSYLFFSPSFLLNFPLFFVTGSH